LAGFILWVTTLGLGQSAPDPWLIVTSGVEGPLNLHTTHSELLRVYGKANVTERDGIEGFSGDMEYVTVLFAKDPERAIEIIWRDEEKKTVPAFVTVRGCKTRWHAARGISLGTSLKDLERLNGQSFKLAGFGWDYSGTVTSWENGALAVELDGGHGRVLVRLDSPPRSDTSEKEMLDVSGDRDFSSQHQAMQKLNPKAYEVMWEFPSWEQKR
jgi:hypothetical protein